MRRNTAPQAGYSLLEVVIALAVLLSFFYIPLGVSEEIASTTDVAVSRGHTQRLAYRTVDVVIGELIASGTQTFSPAPFPDGSSTVQYRRCIGAEAGAALWSTDAVLTLRDADGEVSNGLDDDGDGLVDERELVLIRDGGVERVLTDRVAPLLEGERLNGFDDNGNGLIDEDGFALSVEGTVVHVRLTLMGADGAGRAFTVTAESSVRTRNSTP